MRILRVLDPRRFVRWRMPALYLPMVQTGRGQELVYPLYRERLGTRVASITASPPRKQAYARVVGLRN